MSQLGNIYIDYEQHRIYMDNSTRTAFQVCKEKARLGNVLGWKSKEHVVESPLDFGHALHAGIAAYYDCKAGGYFDSDKNWQPHANGVSATRVAQAAFMEDLKQQGSMLPINIESAESRSLERGVMLIEAYIERWKNEPYENILDASGRPLTEIYFEIKIAQWGEWEIWYCGTIDRIMMYLITNRPVIFETKHTTRALPVFIQDCKPNQQVTGYFDIAWQLMAKDFPDLPEIKQAVWDCIFVSKRMPNTSKALTERFWMWGIDIKSDFARQDTSRSPQDVAEFRFNLEDDALQFAKWLMSGAQRWPRAEHATTCHLYGGCQFRNVCPINSGAQSVLETFFEVRPWDPRKKLRDI